MFPSRYKYGYFSRVRKYNPLVANALSFSLLILRYGRNTTVCIEEKPLSIPIPELHSPTRSLSQKGGSL